MFESIRNLIRRIIHPILWKWYRWYLSDSRWYKYDGLKIRVQPSVFHPGLLFSTKILYRFAQQLPIKNKKVLELGAGSGMIALGLAKAGAKVYASDINPSAVKSMKESVEENKLSLQVFLSNLFTDIPPEYFDFIFINPPYYPKAPKNDQEKAFFCGPEFEYFVSLFQQIPSFLKESSIVYMILTDDCDLDRIEQIATESGFRMSVVHAEKKWGETNLIYQVVG